MKDMISSRRSLCNRLPLFSLQRGRLRKKAVIWACYHGLLAPTNGFDCLIINRPISVVFNRWSKCQPTSSETFKHGILYFVQESERLAGRTSSKAMIVSVKETELENGTDSSKNYLKQGLGEEWMYGWMSFGKYQSPN